MEDLGGSLTSSHHHVYTTTLHTHTMHLDIVHYLYLHMAGQGLLARRRRKALRHPVPLKSGSLSLEDLEGRQGLGNLCSCAMHCSLFALLKSFIFFSLSPLNKTAQQNFTSS